MFWLAFATSLVLTGLLVLILRHAQLLDVPNERSSHQSPTPRGGGAAVMAATTLALAWGDGEVAWVLIAASLLLAGVGLMDDLRSLPALIRLTAQLAVAVFVTVWLSVETEVWLQVFLIGGVLGVIAYVNAFNFMDGVNGISALHAALAGGWFVWVGAQYDVPTLVAVGAALAGASLGFLPWNASGQVFLGDVGSYGIGALVAVSTLAAWSDGVPLDVALAPLSVYFADTGWVLVKRGRAGESLMKPHRDHVYQSLCDSGLGHVRVAILVALVSIVCCIAAAVLAPWVACAAILFVVAAYLIAPQAQIRLKREERQHASAHT